jgi:hypothetical protein
MASNKFIVRTPVAELGYGSLRIPDTKFNPEGDFKQDFFLTPEDAKEFVQMIEADPRATVKGKKAKVKFTKVDGKLKFRSKQHATVKNKAGEVFDMTPKLFYVVDGKVLPYPADAPNIWSGSTGKLELEVTPYEGFGGGLTFRLRGILLHDIVEGKSPGSGWGEVEEGFSSSKRAAPTKDEANESEPEYEVEDEDESEGDERW